MRTILAIASVAFALSTLTAQAQTSAAPAAGHMMTPQQERMKTCNTEAGTKHLGGDARKTFMSDCLAGKATGSTGHALTPQQTKMKSCNTQASSMKGEARKNFMSSCLKG
ncbi:PsiF family protein [Microvirga alba]|uniref:Phosphate-starvation-inducible protein PsiF n=1 Tax=Microvirga alba TaxID=2791025 RepID=A0A931FPI7_9HYPH|nr:PsiF family protein [Microvirga alba]MBF9235024.1 phosphate-starvation-inducible protein PsiF [Microvirga alba]